MPCDDSKGHALICDTLEGFLKSQIGETNSTCPLCTDYFTTVISILKIQETLGVLEAKCLQ